MPPFHAAAAAAWLYTPAPVSGCGVQDCASGDVQINALELPPPALRVPAATHADPGDDGASTAASVVAGAESRLENAGLLERAQLQPVVAPAAETVVEGVEPAGLVDGADPSAPEEQDASSSTREAAGAATAANLAVIRSRRVNGLSA